MVDLRKRREGKLTLADQALLLECARERMRLVEQHRRVLCEIRQLNNRNLADKFGVSPQYVSRFVRERLGEA